ncbi:exported protein of unknown function [Hyphomicrobium sp. MC1]|nr:exported protein of unknown function [Hyphomicrobium sp. MC1]
MAFFLAIGLALASSVYSKAATSVVLLQLPGTGMSAATGKMGTHAVRRPITVYDWPGRNIELFDCRRRGSLSRRGAQKETIDAPSTGS